ncbi:MAG: hypothetical protein KatS3mg115_0663 [Candidatus Poribacteria bacterium]|nr:MAG: hypothetical protein KatS3mg115_0663 [Candidatus Poribacteria bacterium]
MLRKTQRGPSSRRKENASLLTFAEYLRHRRLSHHLTMEELARQLSVSPQFISLLENGKRRPSEKVVRRCAQVFGDDVNYVRFLAQPVPEEQKRALLESPHAPDYLPAELRSNVSFLEADDRLIQELLNVPGPPPPEEDTPFSFSPFEELSPEEYSLVRGLIARIQGCPDRFSPKVRAWADFYEAYYRRCREGRLAAYRSFALTEQRMEQNSEVSYPPKLRYLLSLQLAQAEWEMGEWDAAKAHLQSAAELADRSGEEDGYAVALWLLARLLEEQGQLLEARDLLHQVLSREEIGAFARARCLLDRIAISHLLSEDAEVLGWVAQAGRLWRTRSLDAPQVEKSRALLLVELVGAWSALRLGRRAEARRWLSRARSMRLRVEPTPELRGLYALVNGLFLLEGQRTQQAVPYLSEAEEQFADLPGVRARLYRLEAMAARSLAAMADGALDDSLQQIERLAAAPPPPGTLLGRWQAAVVQLLRIYQRVAQGDQEAARRLAQELLEQWRALGEENPPLREAGPFARLMEKLQPFL